jgi:hypothetical protein
MQAMAGANPRCSFAIRLSFSTTVARDLGIFPHLRWGSALALPPYS